VSAAADDNSFDDDAHGSGGLKCLRLMAQTASTQTFHARFEVFTVVTMKNGVFWDVTPCGSCKNRRFGGT
jgi:hypothetical protein